MLEVWGSMLWSRSDRRGCGNGGSVRCSRGARCARTGVSIRFRLFLSPLTALLIGCLCPTNALFAPCQRRQLRRETGSLLPPNTSSRPRKNACFLQSTRAACSVPVPVPVPVPESAGISESFSRFVLVSVTGPVARGARGCTQRRRHERAAVSSRRHVVDCASTHRLISSSRTLARRACASHS
jgi:hypothetical protein